MALHIADKTGVPTEGFLRYAAGHLDRTLTPTYVLTSKHWLRAIGWRKLPRTLGAITAIGHYVRTSGSEASPAEREAHVRKQFGYLLSAVSPDVPDAAIRPVIDELVSKVLASMSTSLGDPGTQPDSASVTESGNSGERPLSSPADLDGQPPASNG
jgi:hypothetical protein